MTGAERQAAFKAARKAAGYVRREYWATAAEHDKLRAILADIRGGTIYGHNRLGGGTGGATFVHGRDFWNAG